MLFFLLFFFFFNDTATTEIYTLSLHDALPISRPRRSRAWQIPTPPRARHSRPRRSPPVPLMAHRPASRRPGGTPPTNTAPARNRDGRCRQYASGLAPRLLWHATLYRVGAASVGDAPRAIRRQARAHPRFEPLGIARGHGGDALANVRRHRVDRPELVEIGECPRYRDLPRFDRIETRTGPQLAENVDPRRLGAWRQ